MTPYEKSIYQKLESTFTPKQYEGLYPTEVSQPNVFHAHTNLLVALGLWCSGHRSQAKVIIRALQKSALANDNGLYNYSFKIGEGALLRYHSCDGGMAAYVLAVMGDKIPAQTIIKNYFTSPLYQPETGLFIRSIWSDKKTADDRYITQSNLWFVLALIATGQKKHALLLLERTQKKFTDPSTGLLSGISCESNISHIFPDDNALYAICLMLLDQKNPAQTVLQKLLNSDLFDKEQNVFGYDKNGNTTKKHISSYKNHITQAAFRLAGIPLPPFSFKNDDVFADSLALGLWRP